MFREILYFLLIFLSQSCQCVDFEFFRHFKEFTVRYPVGFCGQNQTVKFIYDSEQLILSNAIRSDCQDVQFTFNITESEKDFSIEKLLFRTENGTCGTARTVVYLNIPFPSIEEVGENEEESEFASVTILMVYGWEKVATTGEQDITGDNGIVNSKYFILPFVGVQNCPEGTENFPEDKDLELDKFFMQASDRFRVKDVDSLHSHSTIKGESLNDYLGENEEIFVSKYSDECLDMGGHSRNIKTSHYHEVEHIFFQQASLEISDHSPPYIDVILCLSESHQVFKNQIGFFMRDDYNKSVWTALEEYEQDENVSNRMLRMRKIDNIDIENKFGGESEHFHQSRSFLTLDREILSSGETESICLHSNFTVIGCNDHQHYWFNENNTMECLDSYYCMENYPIINNSKASNYPDHFYVHMAVANFDMDYIMDVDSLKQEFFLSSFKTETPYGFNFLDIYNNRFFTHVPLENITEAIYENEEILQREIDHSHTHFFKSYNSLNLSMECDDLSSFRMNQTSETDSLGVRCSMCEFHYHDNDILSVNSSESNVLISRFEMSMVSPMEEKNVTFSLVQEGEIWYDCYGKMYKEILVCRGFGTCLESGKCKCATEYYGIMCTERYIAAGMNSEGIVKMSMEVYLDELDEVAKMKDSFELENLNEKIIGALIGNGSVLMENTSFEVDVDCADLKMGLYWSKDSNETKLEPGDYICSFQIEYGMIVSMKFSDSNQMIGAYGLIKMAILTNQIEFIKLDVKLSDNGLSDLEILGIVLGGIGVLVVIIVAVTTVIMIAIFGWYRYQRKKVRKFEEIEDIEILLEEQKFVQTGEMAKMKINKNLFCIDYEKIKIEKIIGNGASNSTVFLSLWNDMEVAFKKYEILDGQSFFDVEKDSSFFSSSFFLRKSKKKKKKSESGSSSGESSGMSSSENLKGIKLFEKELSLLLSLQHPHILKCYGATLKVPNIGIVLEYCSQGDLKHFLKQKRKISKNGYPLKEKIRMLYEIATALEHVHSCDVYHRDLKCENVLVDSEDSCKLTDFGLAKIYKKTSTDLKTERIGTNIYIAPEVTLGQGRYSNKCDVFSFGILISLVISENYNPFGENSVGVEIKIAKDPSFRPKIKEKEFESIKWLKSLMKNCYKADPDERPDFIKIVNNFTDHGKDEIEIDDAEKKKKSEKEEKENSFSSVLDPVNQKIRKEKIKKRLGELKFQIEHFNQKKLLFTEKIKKKQEQLEQKQKVLGEIN